MCTMSDYVKLLKMMTLKCSIEKKMYDEREILATWIFCVVCFIMEVSLNMVIIRVTSNNKVYIDGVKNCSSFCIVQHYQPEINKTSANSLGQSDFVFGLLNRDKNAC